MKIFELLNPPTHTVNQVPVSLGVKHITLDRFVAREEREYFDQHGIDTHFKIPVAFAGTVQQKDKDLTDALKRRNDKSFSDPDMEKILDDAILTIGGSGEANRKPGIEGLSQIRSALNSDNLVLIPVPSSGSLTKRFTNKAHDLFGGEVIDEFKKNPREEMSKHGYHTKKGYGEVKTKIKTGEDVYQDNLYQLNNDKDKAIQQIRVRQSRLRPNEQQAYQELQDQIKQIMSDYEVKKQQAMASLKTPEAKKANTQGGQTRALMNTFIPTGKMSDLTGKNVVIVDDNVNSGGTIARMVKAILRQGAKPQSFSAITIHLFEA